MWWRFLTFCVLVCIVLFVVLSCIHGRPVLHLFFHRCCEDDIENDQVIFENFGNNFLRERLVAAEFLVADNESFVSEEEVREIIDKMRSKVNVHDPRSRIEIFDVPNDVSQSEESEVTTKRIGEEYSTVNEADLDLEYELPESELNNVVKLDSDASELIKKFIVLTSDDNSIDSVEESNDSVIARATTESYEGEKVED